MSLATPQSVHCLIILRNYQQFTRDRVPIIFINVYIERVDSASALPPVRRQCPHYQIKQIRVTQIKYIAANWESLRVDMQIIYD